MRCALKVTLVLFAASLTVANPLLFGFGDVPEPVSKWDASVVFEPSKPVPAAAELAQCVDKAAKQLGISAITSTDPAVVKDILTRSMHLDTMPEIQKLLAEELKAPQPLGPTIDGVRKGMSENHPAIGTLICSALENPDTKVAFANPNPEVIKRSLNHLYLLDKIVTKMSVDKDFSVLIKTHLNAVVDKMVGTANTAVRIGKLFEAAGMFGVLKSYTVDVSMKTTIAMRENGPTQKDVKIRSETLKTNILEATGADFTRGYLDNAKVGKELVADSITSIDMTKDTHELSYGVPKTFARLYETWNLAFITGNLQFMDMLYAKLLIPRVILAKNESYIHERLLALWLSIQFYLIADLQKTPHVKYPAQDDVAKLWGKINLRYVNWLKANAQR